MAAAALLTGTEDGFTLQEYARIVAEHAGKAIRHSNMSADDYKAMLMQFKVPKPLAQLPADVDRQAAQGWLDATSGTLCKLIGRPTTPMSKTIADALA